MKKKYLMNRDKKLTLVEFCNTYGIPDDFGIDSIPVKHPEIGEKIYIIAIFAGGVWYRKKPGQAGKDGQMWPLAQGSGFYPDILRVHPDIKKELDGIGSFTKKSSITK